jgi:AraC-like DNA-binding protein
VQPQTLASRRRLYLLARVVVARHYRRRLTLADVAGAVASSPRQVQRAYAQFGELSFAEDLLARRMTAAAQLLAEQPAIPVRDVAHLVGYRQAAHFAGAFRRRYGLAPARFREQARGYRARRPSAAANGMRDLADDRVRSRSTGAGDRGWRKPQTAERSWRADSAARKGDCEPGSDASCATVSAPGRRSRMSVPPPAAGMAAMLPPCWSAT